MTEKREWWSDDLIDAVFKALSYTYLAQGWAGGIAIDLDESVYPLIAAVEDWQDRNQQARAMSMTDNEAAIARVREVCDLWQRRHDTSIRHPTAIPAIAITAVLRALDGTG